MERDNPVHLSTSALWPVSDILPSFLLEKIMHRIKADGLEILPSWAVTTEMLLTGSLALKDPSAVKSLHESWQRDRTEENRRGMKFSFAERIERFLATAPFPPESISEKVMANLQSRYDIPTVFHWMEDTKNYRYPTLEPHPFLHKTPGEVILWVEQDSKRRLAIDISRRKLLDWCQSTGITDKGKVSATVGELLSHARLVHFQIGNKEELLAVQNRDKDSHLAELTRAIKRQNPNLPFIIEVHFPVAIKIFRGRTFRFYSEIVDFIRSI